MSTMRKRFRLGRLLPLAFVLLLAALAAATASLTAQAQDGGGLSLVNHDRDFVERRKDSQGPVQPPLRLRYMRDAERQNRRCRRARDLSDMEIVGVGASPASDAEAQELLEQGLRILARLAVRAYLRREASLPTTDLGEQRVDNPAEG